MAAKAKRKSYTEADKERALHVYAATENLRETSRQLNIPLTTLKQWADAWKVDRANELERIRAEKKQKFIAQADAIIEKAARLIDRRLQTALEREGELDRLMDEMAKNGDMKATERTAIINKIKALEIQRLSDISTTLGTIYDKRALAAGEATENVASVIKVVIDD